MGEQMTLPGVPPSGKAVRTGRRSERSRERDMPPDRCQPPADNGGDRPGRTAPMTAKTSAPTKRGPGEHADPDGVPMPGSWIDGVPMPASWIDGVPMPASWIDGGECLTVGAAKRQARKAADDYLAV